MVVGGRDSAFSSNDEADSTTFAGQAPDATAGVSGPVTRCKFARCGVPLSTYSNSKLLRLTPLMLLVKMLL